MFRLPKSMGLIGCAITVSLAGMSFTEAQSREQPDLIGCYLLVDQLETEYRQRMQSQCLAMAGEMCLERRSDPIACSTRQLNSVGEFIRRGRMKLPSGIEASAFRRAGYVRTLARIDAFLDGAPIECSSGRAPDQTVCEWAAHSLALGDLLWAARLAQIAMD
ncbi:hypothetical protein ACS3SW_17785 [Roseobacteraceae bacterium S113]